MEKTGAQIVAETLIEQGVDVVFGYPGGTVINLYDALYDVRDRLRHVLASHEQGAAHAADGYARSTGKTGVCIATSGPGATNLVTGIATAYLDSIPLVAITGNVTRENLGRDSFQEVDIVGVTVPITKHNFFVKDVSKLAQTIQDAFTIANSGRKGPVLIDIPKDVTIETAEYFPVGKFQPREPKQPKPAYLDEAARMLLEARRPLIYFGGGVISCGAEEQLMELAKRLGAPLASSAMGLSAVPYDFPQYLGLIGMHGTPVANRAAGSCDLLVVVGARFSDRVTGDKSKFATGARILHIDVDESEISKNMPAYRFVVGEAGQVLQELLYRVPRQDNAPWLQELMEYKEKYPLPVNACPDGIDPREVLSELQKSVPGDTIIATDVGQHQMITAQHYRFTHSRTFISSCGLGTMGYGMGAAVGCAVGNPGRRVVLITGDGCFHMNMAELAVAVTEKLPIVVVVMRNGVLGMVRQWQKLFFDRRYSATTLNRQTDFVKLAEAFGAKGLRLERGEDIPAVLSQALAAEGPVVVDCVLSANEDVFPIIPPGGSEQDMILNN